MHTPHPLFCDSPPPVRRVSVLPAVPLHGSPDARFYDYTVPEEITVRVGDYVEIPLGRQKTIGVVWHDSPATVPQAPLKKPFRLKPLIRRFDCPPMTDAMRSLIEWCADYTINPLGSILRMAISVPAALTPPAPVMGWTRAAQGILPARLTPQRARVLDVLMTGPLGTTTISQRANVSAAVVRALIKDGILVPAPLPAPSPVSPHTPIPPQAGIVPRLSPEQEHAANAIKNSMNEEAFAVHVLDGVTGSGKTEVYFDAIAHALERKQQALILLPEIALSAQWQIRFERRFGAPSALWHSRLSPAKRRTLWRAMAEGSVQVVCGARSALFLPLSNVGVIVVDEEHDVAYKQEESPLYNARDMAVVRARLHGIPIVLASATPSMETIANMRQGRYITHSLPSRHGGAMLPSIEAVNIRETPPPPKHWLVPPVVQALEQAFARNEHAMLFLNRRGYAPLTLCRGCGHRMHCPHCQSWLVEHRRNASLRCHFCDYSLPLQHTCPACNEDNTMTACGPGVERIEEEAARLFPTIPRLIATSDTLNKADDMETLVTRMEQTQGPLLLIGTQIVAKGYHFARLSTVGVVDADLGLSGGELRATEATWQMLWQVAGRAGREALKGHVLLQTAWPEHPVMRSLIAGDREQFILTEARARAKANMPPFGRLVALILSGTQSHQTEAYARVLARHAPHEKTLRVLGPAPAPLHLLRGRWRWRLLLKCPKEIHPQPFIRDWLKTAPPPGSVKVSIDVDPYSFL